MLVSHYWSGDTLRSRSVSDVVLTGTLDVPAPPPRLLADWKRDVSSRLQLEPGDVEALMLARARLRWPDYKHCVQAVSDWTRSLGLQEVLASCDVALMACRGAAYHHDGAHYGGMAFCNLFLIEDIGQDLHFPATGHRIQLTRGTVVIFDTGQPHAIISRGGSGFHADDFPADQDCTQIFLTWELPIENPSTAQILQVLLDVVTTAAPPVEDEQISLNGVPATGQWCTEVQ